jgi:hypothetical protein
MVVGFTTTCAISDYHHWSCEFEPHSLQGVLNTTFGTKLWTFMNYLVACMEGNWGPNCEENCTCITDNTMNCSKTDGLGRGTFPLELEPSWSWSFGSWIYNYLCNQWLSPLELWVWTAFIARCTRYNICDKVCQWLATGQWFSPGTLFSSTNKIDRHLRQLGTTFWTYMNYFF